MSEQDIDSQLKGLLDLLRPTPERNPADQARSRRRFDADLQAVFPVAAPQHGALRSPVKPYGPRPAAANLRPRPRFYRTAYAYLAISLLLLAALFSAGAVTVQAAGAALPGDALYSLKLDVEEARLALAANPARQAELHLEFAHNRLTELNSLAALGQYNQVAPLVAEVDRQVMLAVAAARRLTERDPALAFRLQDQARMTLGLFKANMDALIIAAPPQLQPALKTTLDQALEDNPPAATPNANPNPGANNNSNGQGNAGNVNNNGNPGSVGNGNSNENSNANPNSNKDKTKDKNNNGNKDKDKDKNNNGNQDKDKNNNGQNKKNNN